MVKNFLFFFALVLFFSTVNADYLVQSCNAIVRHTAWEYTENTHEENIIINMVDSDYTGLFGKVNCLDAEKIDLPLDKKCGSFYIKITQQKYNDWPDEETIIDLNESNNWHGEWHEGSNWFKIDLNFDDSGRLNRIYYYVKDGLLYRGGPVWELYCKECECTGGTCCDGCNFKDETVVCDSNFSSELGCPWGNNAGSNVGKRVQIRYCSGNSAECNGNLVWQEWALFEECDENFFCDSITNTCKSVSFKPFISDVNVSQVEKDGNMILTVVLENVDKNHVVDLNIVFMDSNNEVVLAYHVKQSQKIKEYDFGKSINRRRRIDFSLGTYKVSVKMIENGCITKCEKKLEFEVMPQQIDIGSYMIMASIPILVIIILVLILLILNKKIKKSKKEKSKFSYY